MMRTLLSMIAATLLLGACASFNSLDSEVSTYGHWPADRKPASYAFERLPSQQAHPQGQQALEDAARGAVEAAGFGPATDADHAEYLLQIGARVVSSDAWIYDDPWLWRGGVGFRHPIGPWGPGWGVGWNFGYPASARFERQVSLLVRDRKTGGLLYEARASNTGLSPTIDAVLPAMFEAAMKDFSADGPNPRSVTVPLSRP